MLGCFFVATARVAAYDAMRLLVCFLLHPFAFLVFIGSPSICLLYLPYVQFCGSFAHFWCFVRVDHNSSAIFIHISCFSGGRRKKLLKALLDHITWRLWLYACACKGHVVACADTLSRRSWIPARKPVIQCHSAFAVSEAQKDAFDLLSVMEAFSVRSELWSAQDKPIGRLSEHQQHLAERRKLPVAYTLSISKHSSIRVNLTSWNESCTVFQTHRKGSVGNSLKLFQIKYVYIYI